LLSLDRTSLFENFSVEFLYKAENMT